MSYSASGRCPSSISSGPQKEGSSKVDEQIPRMTSPVFLTSELSALIILEEGGSWLTLGLMMGQKVEGHSLDTENSDCLHPYRPKSAKFAPRKLLEDSEDTGALELCALGDPPMSEDRILHQLQLLGSLQGQPFI